MNSTPLFHAALKATLRLDAPVARVFPLLCPVREALWLPGWSAKILHSESGVAELGCVFRTHDADGRERIWTVSRHEPDPGLIQFVQFVPGTCVIRLEIVLEQAGSGCLAHWTYTVDGLEAGHEAFFAAYAQEPFLARMAGLQGHLAAYLATPR